QQPLALQVPIVSAHYHHDAGLWGAALWSREQ
ncbi:N-acetylmannosamine kinase, partial [Klebsiella pneumoniae]|nr:N-acetylmannosamine kinase [Klebsiella pneumoniae]